MLTWEELYGAEEDSKEYPVYVDDLNEENLKKFGKPLRGYFSYLRENPKLQLNQDEFLEGSPYCTLYAHFAHRLHYHGSNLTPSERKDIIDWYDKKGIVTLDGGNSAMKTASYWGRCLRELDIVDNVDTYYFKTGDEKMVFLMQYYNHAFVSSFVISEYFIKDREDDLFINANVHGGKEYGGHAIMYEIVNNDLVVANSYVGRRTNHFVIHKGKVGDRFNLRRENGKRWVREYSALHIYG